MIIKHQFSDGAFSLGDSSNKGQFSSVWPKESGQTLMVGFDGPTSLFGFDDEPHMAIYLPFDHVQLMTAEMFASLGTKLVLTPLLAPKFDAMDLATHLIALGYQGAYRAVIDKIPDSSLVRREILAFYPQLDFDVVEIGNCRVQKFPTFRR